MRFKDPQVLGPGLYRTDAFHRTPLFAVRPPGHDPDKPPLVVKSWEEAYALHGPPDLDDIDPIWIGHFITEVISADASPYQRISRLPRAHDVVINPDGSIKPFSYNALAGGADPMNAAELHIYIRESLLENLRSNLEGCPRPIGCEQSSGIDSNAILGGMIRGLNIEPAEIITLSNKDGGEAKLLEEFQDFYGLDRDHAVYYTFKPTGRPHPSVLSGNYECIEKLGAPTQVAYMPMAEPLEKLKNLGVKILYSGYGGDECISHPAENVSADLVAQGRWQELVQWCGGKRRAIKTTIARKLSLSSRAWLENKARAWHIQTEACHIHHFLSAEGRNFLKPPMSSFEQGLNHFLPLRHSIRNMILDPFVAMRLEEETRMASASEMKKVFPYLDEYLISTLLNQDPIYFSQRTGKGRLISRKAFGLFLPPELQNNPTKRRTGDIEEMEALTDYMSEEAKIYMSELTRTMHPWLRRWLDLDRLQHAASMILDKSNNMSVEVWIFGCGIERLIVLNSWLSQLDG